MKKLILVSFLFIITVLLVVNLYFTYRNEIKLKDSEWVCIAQTCSKYISGDEWVKQNCNPEGGEMLCNFEYEGELFKVPLSGIQNTSMMVGCAEYQCTSRVLITYEVQN